MDINSIGSTVPVPGVTSAPRAQTPSPATPAATREQRQPTGAATDVPTRREAPESSAPVSSPEAVIGKEGADDPQNEEAFRESLRQSVEELNEFVLPYNTSLRFSIEEEMGTVIVKVTDKETQEVIKQIPSEEAIELAKALDKLKGLLIQQQA
jgi:flagellar protein FlaG